MANSIRVSSANLERKKSENLNLRVLKSGGWTQPVTKMLRRGESPKGGATGEILNFTTANCWPLVTVGDVFL